MGVVKPLSKYFYLAYLALIILQIFIGTAISTEPNEPPTIESLTPDQLGPQKTGSIITWAAKASDPDGDEIFYRFLLKGPRSQGKEEVVKDWDKSGVWSWEPNEVDIGLSNIIVQVRDEKHAGANVAPRKSEIFEISGIQQSFLNVQVRNDVFSPGDPRIYYCDDGGHRSIQNRIYLAGPDLNQVSEVTYILHPSFYPNEILSNDALNDFEIEIMAWGRFEMKAIVVTRNGQKFDIPFAFQFKSKVLEAQSLGIPMIRKC